MTSHDRRGGERGPLFQARRRFPRLHLPCDVFYQSEERSLMSSDVDVSLSGLFVACRFAAPEGERGVVLADSGDGPLVRLEVEVLRRPDLGRRGMALKVVSMSDVDRRRWAAYLLRRGGLPVLPQLDRLFRTVTRLPRPLPPLVSAA